MKSQTPKVLHPVLGKPMLSHVLASASALDPSEIIVVTDPASSDFVQLPAGVEIAIQDMALGTADAVASGVASLSLTEGAVLVLNGDVPLIRASSLRALVDTHRSTAATITLATFNAPATTRYGSVRRRSGQVIGIVEAADDDRANQSTIEANGGIYVFDAGWLREHIAGVHVSASGEYYLTSLAAMLARSKDNQRIISTVRLDEDELLGVDDRERLSVAEKTLQRRILVHHMRAGVTILDPDRTVIEADVEIQQDVRIEPGCFIRGESRIESGSTIGPYSVIESSTIGCDAKVLQSWIAESTVGDGVSVGPFSRIRPGSVIEEGVQIGNFVETKATRIGSGSRVHHFSYLGDAQLGENVNVGAGTITCNYDGKNKHRTVIGNDVFVGCDTMLVAPVELGAGSRTGAGAVVTRSVPAGKTVVGVPARPIQRRTVATTQEEHGR